MHQRLLDPYDHRSSAVHRLPAAGKLAAALAFILFVVLLPRPAWLTYGLCGAALIAVAALSRISLLNLAKKLLLLEPFVIGVAALSILQPGGTRIFLTLLTRSTLCLFCMVLLSSTTRFSDILHVLRRLRVPPLMVTTLSLLFRYLSLLVEESSRMNRARRSRTLTSGRWPRWRSSATVISHLFVRSSERAERIYAAMRARGWQT